MAASKGNMPYGGFDKEPPVQHGPKERGKSLVHSHSMKPRHKIAVSKRGRKR